jgi:ParB-like chromosome segregation protein Spo0J
MEQSRSAGTAPTDSGGPVLKNIPLHLITAIRNPRHTAHIGHTWHTGHVSRSPNSTSSVRGHASIDTTDTGPDPGPDADLEGLARSLGSQDEPRLVEPPLVEEMPGGLYRLCAGERRVDAARLAGWTDIPCLVYMPMDPARAHTLSLLENMHRLPMHPLEEISALCISRLLANADARGIGEGARHLLQDAWEQSTSSYSIIQSLERILRDSGWVPERPNVTWKAHLDDLGISMAPWERKRKLRMLNIDPALQEQLRELDITEAALRSLGTLEPEEQKRVVEALVANPSLARKVRRVARARRDGFYTSIEDALAEVQGLSRTQSTSTTSTSASRVPTAGTDRITLPSQVSSAQDATETTVSPEVQDAVLQLLECADRFSAAMNSLEAYGGGAVLPEPWGAWSRDALNFIEGLLPGRVDGPEAHSA